MRLPAITVGLAALVCGCATIIHGAHEDVGISSTPTAAKVTIDNQERGATPLIANLSRKDNHIVKIEMDGYQPYETTLTRTVSGWVWGNIVFGGIPGLAVDAISGGLYGLTPNQIQGQLVQRTAARGDRLYIVVVMRPDTTWRKVGQLLR